MPMRDPLFRYAKSIEAVIFDREGVVVSSDRLQIQAEQITTPIFAEQHQLDYNPDSIDWDAMQGWARRKIAATIFSVLCSSNCAWPSY